MNDMRDMLCINFFLRIGGGVDGLSFATWKGGIIAPLKICDIYFALERNHQGWRWISGTILRIKPSFLSGKVPSSRTW